MNYDNLTPAMVKAIVDNLNMYMAAPELEAFMRAMDTMVGGLMGTASDLESRVAELEGA